VRPPLLPHPTNLLTTLCERTSRLPGLVSDYLEGKLSVDAYITHTGILSDINTGFGYMKTGDCIRCVVDMNK
jgi:S-(hydroxymethyl)glutathione dehydrogenase/alcohol dehydrogenase